MFAVTRLILLFSAIAFVTPKASALFPPDFDAERTPVEPLFDTPMRDTAICRGGDGAWYLTGTVASAEGDFQNTTGVQLWRSEDFKSWDALGEVWNIETHATEPQSAWQLVNRPNPENPGGPLVRGIVSPEIVFAKDTYWIAYSMNAQGTGLLKSTSGQPQGPYQDLGRFTVEGSDASLFVDDDGSAYWVVGQGWLARLKEDLSSLAEPPKRIRTKFFSTIPIHGARYKMPSTNAPVFPGAAGAHLWKANGRYWLMTAMVRDRIGVGCYDTFVYGSDTIDGLYTQPLLSIPHGGQVTVFPGPGDVWHATFAGRDSRARLRDRPAAVPLDFDDRVLYGGREDNQPAPFPSIRSTVRTEFGPWDRTKTAAPYRIRDLQFSFAPDGYAYLTGSGTDAAFTGRIMVLRSKDMTTWETVDVQFDFLSIPGVTEEDRAARFDDPKQRNSLGSKYMDSEIYYLAGTFHIFTSLYGVNKPDGTPAFSGPMWLRSTTGKPEGPYAYVARARAQSSVFVDDDGTVYLVFNGNLLPFDPKGDTLEGAQMVLRTTMGTAFAKGDVATNLAKIHGKYVMFATGWCGGTYGENYRIDGTYDWVYWQSDTLEGPYDMVRRAYAMPHAGHSCVPQKGADGRWYGLLFGNENTSPWLNYPGVLLYDVKLDPADDTVRITTLDEIP